MEEMVKIENMMNNLQEYKVEPIFVTSDGIAINDIEVFDTDEITDIITNVIVFITKGENFDEFNELLIEGREHFSPIALFKLIQANKEEFSNLTLREFLVFLRKLHTAPEDIQDLLQ